MSVALVTGANRGIGLELVRQLDARGDSVVAVCRKASPELSETGVEIIDGVDVTTDDGISKIVAGIGRDPSIC